MTQSNGVVSRDGVWIETVGDRWQVGQHEWLIFDRVDASDADAVMVDAALRSWDRHCIARHSAKSVKAYHDAVRRALKVPSLTSRLRFASGLQILHSTKQGLKTLVSDATIAGTLRSVRAWYVFSADRVPCDLFRKDVAREMERIQIPAPIACAAVRSLDPDKGALSRADQALLLSALSWARENDALDLPTLVAGVMLFALGANPECLAQLEEADLSDPVAAGAPFILQMPLIKQGMPRRGGFGERLLAPEIGTLVRELIDHNRSVAPVDPDRDRVFGRPLFRRLTPARRGVIGGPFEAGMYRMPKNWFCKRISRLPEILQKKGLQHALPKLTPRRLRYAFCSRNVMEGLSDDQIARIMGHSGTRTLLWYTDLKLDIVQLLDEKLGPVLKPIAALLSGTGSQDAVRQALPWEETHPGGIDTSTAPFACLGCRLFRPVDDEALRDMAADLHARAGKQAGSEHRELEHLAERAEDAATACSSQRWEDGSPSCIAGRSTGPASNAWSSRP